MELKTKKSFVKLSVVEKQYVLTEKEAIFIHDLIGSITKDELAVYRTDSGLPDFGGVHTLDDAWRKNGQIYSDLHVLIKKKV